MDSTHPSDDTYKAENPFRGNLWKENHGNLLLAVTGLICIVGSTILACRQTRFRPPGFPTRLTPDGVVGSMPADASLVDSAGNPTGLRRVNVRILGAASDRGVMKVAAYTSPNGFNDPANALGTDNWKIASGECVGTFELPSAITHLAISAYHDENGNDKLDRNSLGIPSERYGFSGDARSNFGPPPFDDARVELGDAPIEISIR